MEYRDILSKNFGFNFPEKWLDYAKNHNFELVKFNEINSCLDCGSSNYVEIGQYIYYSTLHTIKECSNCHLCYVNVLIDEQVRVSHFEKAYKSEEYFRNSRKDIFIQTLDLIKKKSKNKNNILELGAATGEFAVNLRELFPESKITLNDISVDACKASLSKGFNVLSGSIFSINTTDKFDVLIALDVLYYESSIKESFEKIYSLVAPGGVLILRLPNKFLLIKIFAYLNNVIKKDELKVKLRFFNPEHLFIFSQKYLYNKLIGLGFESIEILPSALLRTNKNIIDNRVYYYFFKFIKLLTGKTISPSMFVLAKKPNR